MIRLLLPLTLLFSVNSASAKLNVFACEPEWAALSTALLPEGTANIFSATTAKQDPHFIQARPSLIAKARRADVLICSGSELEAGWLPLLLRKSGNPKIQHGKPGHFMATEYVERLGIHQEVDRSMGDVHAGGNPHVQLSPFRMATIAEHYTKLLTSQLPKHAAKINQNMSQLVNDLRTLGRQTQEKFNQSKSTATIVAHHDNWVYLSDWLNKPINLFIEPKPGVAPSTAHLTWLVTQLEDKPNVVILSAVYMDEKPVTWLANKIGAIAIRTAISPTDWERKNSLLDWYGELSAIFVKALLDE